MRRALQPGWDKMCCRKWHVAGACCRWCMQKRNDRQQQAGLKECFFSFFGFVNLYARGGTVSQQPKKKKTAVWRSFYEIIQSLLVFDLVGMRHFDPLLCFQ